MQEEKSRQLQAVMGVHADRFGMERENDRKLLRELESQLSTTIHDRENELEEGKRRADRLREELKEVQGQLMMEKEKVRTHNPNP